MCADATTDSGKPLNAIGDGLLKGWLGGDSAKYAVYLRAFYVVIAVTALVVIYLGVKTVL